MLYEMLPATRDVQSAKCGEMHGVGRRFIRKAGCTWDARDKAGVKSLAK